jgi:hypothetical protein
LTKLFVLSIVVLTEYIFLPSNITILVGFDKIIKGFIMKIVTIFYASVFFISTFLPSGVLGQHTLTLSFSGMGPHSGQQFGVRVIDMATAEEVGRTMLAEIPQSGTFDLELLVLIPENNYRVDFFADFNDNGMYDTPPADHAWRLELEGVQGDWTGGVTVKHGEFSGFGTAPDFGGINLGTRGNLTRSKRA